MNPPSTREVANHARSDMDYFEQRKVVDRLAEVIKAIDDYAPEES